MSHDPLDDFDQEILRFLSAAGVDSKETRFQIPAQREFGERSTTIAFDLAKERRQNPVQVAEEIAARFDGDQYRYISSVEPAGKGFLNFRLSYREFTRHTISSIRQAGPAYGRPANSVPENVVVEHTSVNPNKEWHIGHVRNAVLGDVIARILRQRGDEVEVQNYIDDTGVQAAQAVTGLVHFPEERRPNEKYDQYFGRMYVKIAAELGAETQLKARRTELGNGSPDAVTNAADEIRSVDARLENVERLQGRVLSVMHQLELGEHAETVRAVVDGQLETAARLGVSYDLLTWESHLVQSHLFDQAMEMLESSPHVYRATTGRYSGALVIETGPPPVGEDEIKCEVLIRSNNVPTYVGKDIAYHMWKFGLLPDRLGYVPFRTNPDGRILRSTSLHGDRSRAQTPDRVINVIMVHQSAAQDAVKLGLRAAGFSEAADDLFHLAYGMVSTDSGRISGRKGTTVSGDSVIDEAVRAALERVTEKRSQDLTESEMHDIAEAVGVGSVRYFMIQYNPLRDIVFDVASVVSYDGNTALYVQYALVRMFAILRKAEEQGIATEEIDSADLSVLTHEQEKCLVFHMALYPDTIRTVSRTLAANLVAEFAYDLATIFSQFYRDCGVLNAEQSIRAARLLLVRTVRDVLANACGILGVPVIERL